MITHNNEIAQLADRIVRIEDGKIYQITDLEFTEENITTLEKDKICITATVSVAPWDIVAVEPSYGE